MSDSQEKSDDLIAELAKLMASDAGAGENGPKPTVIKLPPINDATIAAAGPVRIPGMDTSAAPPAPPVSHSAPMVRIPGMERPAGIDPAPAPAPKPIAHIDFGQPPSAPVIKTEPLANWQTQPPPAMTPASTLAKPIPDMKFERVTPAPSDSKPAPVMTRIEPKASPGMAAPAPLASEKPQPGSSDNFNFDFGFGGKGGESRQPPVAANDPIADLIAAELDAADGTPADEPASGNQSPPPVAAKSVTPAPQPARGTPAAIQIKPVSVTPRSSEGDRFTIAPVFGAGNKPSPAVTPTPVASTASAPRVDLDPMDEIESLIGEAVRVELSTPEKPSQTTVHAAPVVPPLNTGFAPRRAGLKDNDLQSQTAEAAILAAAAASGAEVDRIDAPVAADDRPYKRMKVKPPKTSFISSGARQYVGIAVAGTLLLAAGFGLYWVLGMNRADDPATAPVLTADVTPAKVEPSMAVAATTEPSGSVVFDEIDGVAAVDNGETLVSRDETAGASVTDVARAVTPVAEAESESGLANRKVRTVTVRPDGTIVSGDDAVAGTEVLPVERPNVPQIAGTEMKPSDLLTAVAETQAASGQAAPQAAANDPIAALVSDTGAATTTPLADPAPLEVASATPQNSTPAVFDGSLVAPHPMPRPSDRNGMVGGASQQAVALIEPVPAAASAIKPAATPLVAVAQEQPQASSQVRGGGGAYVQLSSQRSESDANQSLKATSRRMAGTLQGAQLEIRRVDLGAKGVWYRVVLPVSSFQDATQTCAAIKSNGGDCVAING